MELCQAPDELIKKFVDLGFKKMWVNKEYQKFQKMVIFFIILIFTSCFVEILRFLG